MLKRPAILCASLLFAAVFVFGLVRLFELRFERGDVYPPYSTLRTDPLGASVLYEGLGQVPGMAPERYFDETFKKDDGQGHDLFVLGTEPGGATYLSRAEYNTIQRFVFNGGRVVIAYYPRVTESWSSRLASTNDVDEGDSDYKKSRRHHKKAVSKTDAADSGTNSSDSAESPANTNAISSTNDVAMDKDKQSAKPRHTRSSRRAEKPSEDDEDQSPDDYKREMLKYADLEKEWGFGFHYVNLKTNVDGELEFPEAGMVAHDVELPARLTIHTSLCFTNLTNGWATIYQRDKKTPVVVERKFGAGTVVLVADSYPFSNEAMFKSRSAPLLAWMLGNGREVIFDEAHLGIVEQPGMATLMRRYQLHGLIFSLIVVAGLFVWKNSLSLVPPHDDTRTNAGLVVAGRDSASGFVNLVRRGIAPSEIINVCFAEWKKSGARAAAVSPAQRHEVDLLIQQQAALEPRQRNPVETYRHISQILKRRK